MDRPIGRDEGYSKEFFFGGEGYSEEFLPIFNLTSSFFFTHVDTPVSEKAIFPSCSIYHS